MYLEMTSAPHCEVLPPLFGLQKAVTNVSRDFVFFEPPVLQEDNL